MFARERERQRFRLAFEHLRAVKAADEALAAILRAVRESGEWERTAGIPPTTPRRTDRSGGSASGPACPLARIDRRVSAVDTAATALRILGLAAEGLDGRQV